jgi:hypothetical protein
LTNVRVEIGPTHLGDRELARDFFRRISLNFGTTMRAYTPVDTTLPKRINASRFISEGKPTVIMQLEGDGLRPNEDRDKAAAGELPPTDQEAAAANSIPAVLQGLLQGAGVAPGPNLPFVPFPIPPSNQDPP